MPQIELNTRKNLVIKKALVEHMGWTNATTLYWRIKSPTRPLYFAYNTFSEFEIKPTANGTEEVFIGRLKFKISDFRKLVLDTDAKMLIFGNGVMAVNVA